MQLAEESISYEYEGLLAAQPKTWDLLTELQSQHFLSPDRLEALRPLIMTIRGQVAAERDLRDPPAKLQPLLSGFIDLPQQLLDTHRRKGEESELGRVMAISNLLREETDRIILLGTGGSYLGPKALFDALCHAYHNELPSTTRLGKPRIYFEGNSLDNDSLQDLLELFENVCVDPELAAERWGVILISKTGDPLETSTTYRILRTEAARYYGSRSERLKRLLVPVTGPSGKLRGLCKADGYQDNEILTFPENVGSRYAVFTPAGLLPAATMGLDVRALLIGASTITRRFLEEPFERNPVLQFAAINHLLHEELGKSIRVMAVWDKRLESVGGWYAQLLSESLGKHGRGPTPVTTVQTRDQSSSGQQLREGSRDKLVNHLVVKASRHAGIQVGMADHNEDDLNTIARKTFPEMQEAALHMMQHTLCSTARPTANIVLPVVSEHTLGQLMQMLMLATVVEARLMGVNPYSRAGTDTFEQQVHASLRPETK